MWAYVALTGLIVVILGMIFGWMRYRQRQAVELSQLEIENRGLKDALAACEAARRHEKRGRSDVRDALGGLRPPGDADTSGAAKAS